MTREEIISKGVPIEPNCFETDREEQWYKVGLYEGATSNPWHSVADGDLPQNSNEVLCQNGIELIVGYFSMVDNCFYDADSEDRLTDVEYWMEFPQLPRNVANE
ncbi:hypothetical protein [uncultured Alloprevotella sp.]|uniref:hypothetical protein n=1 Tax=uncultured Alloprevotella sp. TaxID=1283315 RepID=UPI0025FA6355|nr:hypothetical protein [uncultured Alloprevotella sp.]